MEIFFQPENVSSTQSKVQRKWWWHKWKSDGILSRQAGFESRVRLWLFSVQNCCQSILTGPVSIFLITCNRTVLLLSCFPSSFTIVKIINCYLTMYQEKVKINPKRGRERPIFKKRTLTAEKHQKTNFNPINGQK